MSEVEFETPPPDRVRPTRADQDAFARFQASALERALADARVWRNGYAMLASGIAAVLAVVGTRLTDTTPWGWRLALSVTLGGALVMVARALWMALTVEGGRRAARLSLGPIVERYNSFEIFQVDQADAAITRLARSKRWALAGGLLCFVGLMFTLWVSSPTEPNSPAPAGNASPTSTPGYRSSTTGTPTATP